jgi:hypothetical protein
MDFLETWALVGDKVDERLPERFQRAYDFYNKCDVLTHKARCDVEVTFLYAQNIVYARVEVASSWIRFI